LWFDRLTTNGSIHLPFVQSRTHLPFVLSLSKDMPVRPEPVEGHVPFVLSLSKDMSRSS